MDFGQPCDIDLWVMKRRSPWPIFHSPVILPYILKTFWYMNIILQDYESVWHNNVTTFDLKINVGHCDPYFMIQWFCLISWRLFDVWISYFRIMSRYDLTFDLKINVGCFDLYFMVQWFCIISWSLFDIWTPYFGIMNQYDPVFDLKIIVGCCDLYFMVHILKTVCCMNFMLHDYESVWSEIWPQNKCRSLWPIFHGLVILPYILKTVQ